MRINDSSSEEEDVPLPQPGDMHVKFKKSSLPKRAKLSNNRSIPSRFRQKSKGDLCDKILKLELEVDDLKEEIALLNYNMKKLKAQLSSPPSSSSRLPLYQKDRPTGCSPRTKTCQAALSTMYFKIPME